MSTPLPSSEEMASMDAATIAAGTPGITLMERAAQGVSEVITREFMHSHLHAHVLVVCGPGNNGGDGAAVSRLLQSRGCSVVTVVAAATRYSPDFISNVNRLTEVYVFGGEASFGKCLSESSFERLLRSSTIIIDCLLGTGQDGAPRGALGRLCQLVAEHKKNVPVTVIAVDVPTGINASTGEVYEPHINADCTITVQFTKRGMIQYPAHSCCGRIIEIDIGIFGSPGAVFSAFSRQIPFVSRHPADHKGKFRKVIVLSGDEAMRGASILASHAALRSGASLVVRVVPGKQTLSSQVWPEIMHERISGITKKGSREFLKLLPDSSVVVIGPGLGISKDTQDFLAGFISAANAKQIPYVLDADGLNTLAKFPKKKSMSLDTAVITPHPGEAARLLHVNTEEIQRDRYLAAHLLARKTGAVTLLKGASTVVYDGMRGVVNTTGNPYLATGGSGDVLSGVVAAFLAQGLSQYHAAQWGAYIHGRAGDIANEVHHGPIIASDIIEALPSAMGEAIRG